MSKRERTTDSRVEKMTDGVLACRDDRHDLGAATFQRWRFPDWDVVEIRSPCKRCGAERIKMVREVDGELYRPTRYDYPDGYLNPEPGTGRIPLPAVRLERVRRWLDTNPLPIVKPEKATGRASGTASQSARPASRQGRR